MHSECVQIPYASDDGRVQVDETRLSLDFAQCESPKLWHVAGGIAPV